MNGPRDVLYKRLVETKLVTQASAEADTLHDPGWMMFTAVLPKDGDLPAAR